MIQRREIALCVILSIITCGIYGLYWVACIQNDMNTLTGDSRTSGGTVVVLCIITCNIYGIYWAYKMGEKIDMLKSRSGVPSSNSPILYLILYFVGGGLISWALMQNELNNFAQNNQQ